MPGWVVRVDICTTHVVALRESSMSGRGGRSCRESSREGGTAEARKTRDDATACGVSKRNS